MMGRGGDSKTDGEMRRHHRIQIAECGIIRDSVKRGREIGRFIENETQ
jgi:hypothetical protein